jgi:ABC-type sugar transport system ATPase subunit
MSENVLEIRELVKDFPGVRAVDRVSFGIKRNTVHCLSVKMAQENPH